MAEASYKGWQRWTPTSDEWLDLYTEGKIPFQLKENEYLIVKTGDGTTTFYCNENGRLRKFTGGSIKTYIQCHLKNRKEKKGILGQEDKQGNIPKVKILQLRQGMKNRFVHLT